MNKIIFKNVSSQYRRSKSPQLENINLEIKEGELTLLAGPSGSGKSTLVQLLNGIIPHHTRAKVTGTINVFEKDPIEETVLEMSRFVGILLQDPDSQLATSRVVDEIILTLEFQGKTSEEIDDKVGELLQQFKIMNLAGKDSTRLSGGEKQLVALTAMMSSDPSIIILDEPTSNLDPVNTIKVLRHIDRFKNDGKTVILIEHKLNEVFNNCPPDRILLMDNGKILIHQTPRKVFESPLFEKIGLDIPEIVKYIKKSGLLEKNRSSYPWSYKEFRDYIQNLDHNDLEKLKNSLQPPKRINHISNKQLILFEDVSYKYRDQLSSAVKGVNFSANNGEFVAIIGNNGAGKSSLVKHIIGLNKPELGNVWITGINTKKTTSAKLASSVSFLFQNPDNQIFSSTVLKEVKYGPLNCKVPKLEAEKRSKEAIFFVNLEDFIDHNPIKLSMGQKQRVAVASALAMLPKIIVLDEPTTGQDPSSLKGIIDLMLKEYEKLVTIVMVTHDMNLVDRVANRVILMNNGQVEMDGEIDTVFNNQKILRKCGLEPPIRVQMLSILNE
ncbi:MAG: ABC transporter ATP-binding protein [Candidatus Hodarchaeales archaeon]